MSWEILIPAILGSSLLTAVVTALATRKKNSADASATNVKSILEVDTRLNERIVKLEERVAALERENLELKQRELMLTHENNKNLELISQLKSDVAALEEENEMLRNTNYELVKRLEIIEEK